MNPFVKLNLDDEKSLQHIASEAARFVRSGLGSIAEWITLDPPVQEAILAAREMERLQDARAMAACMLDPAQALGEFSRPLDGGKTATDLRRGAERAAAMADMQADTGEPLQVVSLTDMTDEQAKEAGITIE